MIDDVNEKYAHVQQQNNVQLKSWDVYGCYITKCNGAEIVKKYKHGSNKINQKAFDALFNLYE